MVENLKDAKEAILKKAFEEFAKDGEITGKEEVLLTKLSSALGAEFIISGDKKSAYIATNTGQVNYPAKHDASEGIQAKQNNVTNGDILVSKNNLVRYPLKHDASEGAQGSTFEQQKAILEKAVDALKKVNGGKETLSKIDEILNEVKFNRNNNSVERS